MIINSSGMIKSNLPEIKEEKNQEAEILTNETESEDCTHAKMFHRYVPYMFDVYNAHETKELKECYHDIDKRLSIVERLLDCLMKKGL